MAKNSNQAFLTDDGIALNRMMWEEFLNHMVDHSRWHDLQITSHSFRIGGATAWELAGLEAKKIQRLGRWKDSTMFSYIRDFLIQEPDDLRKIPALKMKRKRKEHIFCNCRLNNPHGDFRRTLYTSKRHINFDQLSDRKKTQYYISRKNWRQKSTEQREIQISKRIQNSITIEGKNFNTATHLPPDRLLNARRLLLKGTPATPINKKGKPDWDIVKNEYDNNKDWFTLAVYCMRRRWCRFQMAQPKLSATEKAKRGFVKGHKAASCKEYSHPNTAIITPADKNEASALLRDMDEYTVNMTAEQAQVWSGIKPNGTKLVKCLPNFIITTQTLIDRCKEYAEDPNYRKKHKTRALAYNPRQQKQRDYQLMRLPENRSPKK